jgi:hypothetical protein
MISALSQSQKQQATSHAGKQKNVQQAPTAPQQQASTGTTDAPNTLPPTPDDSTNQTQPQQQIIVVKKEEPWWKKALPFVAAGVVGLAGAVFGLRRLGQKFHETNIKPYLDSIKNSEGDYYKKVFKPISEIANALDTHEKTSPGGDKAILDSLREQLLITPEGIGSMHHIILGEENHVKNIHTPLVNHKGVEENIAKLPEALRTEIQGIYDKYKQDNPTAQNGVNDKLPQIKLAVNFKQKDDKLETSTDFKDIETGLAIIRNSALQIFDRTKRETQKATKKAQETITTINIE